MIFQLWQSLNFQRFRQLMATNDFLVLLGKYMVSKRQRLISARTSLKSWPWPPDKICKIESLQAKKMPKASLENIEHSIQLWTQWWIGLQKGQKNLLGDYFWNNCYHKKQRKFSERLISCLIFFSTHQMVRFIDRFFRFWYLNQNSF